MNKIDLNQKSGSYIIIKTRLSKYMIHVHVDTMLAGLNYLCEFTDKTHFGR